MMRFIILSLFLLSAAASARTIAKVPPKPKPAAEAKAEESQAEGEQPIADKASHTLPDNVIAALETSLTLKVGNREVVADKIVAAAEEAGGYFASRDDSSVVLKVPVRGSLALVDNIRAMGIVASEDHNAVDIGSQILEAQTLLRSRQGIFDSYFKVLKTARVDTVVTVEREMTSLVQQIEELQGRLKGLGHRRDFHRITVSFEFKDRRAPVPTGDSSFPWLNTVNLVDLQGDFSHAF